MVHCRGPCGGQGRRHAAILLAKISLGRGKALSRCGCDRVLVGVGTILPRPALFLSVDDGDHNDENRSSHPPGQPEPQGPRQRTHCSARHHQGPSRRREEQHPRTGRARQSDAEHEQPPVRVRGAAELISDSNVKQLFGCHHPPCAQLRTGAGDPVYRGVRGLSPEAAAYWMPRLRGA